MIDFFPVLSSSRVSSYSVSADVYYSRNTTGCSLVFRKKMFRGVQGKKVLVMNNVYYRVDVVLYRSDTKQVLKTIC